MAFDTRLIELRGEAQEFVTCEAPNGARFSVGNHIRDRAERLSSDSSRGPNRSWTRAWAWAQAHAGLGHRPGHKSSSGPNPGP